ncbi:hypothetical protein [Kitasatospora sp. NPDC002040]|uniref:WXG100 family type VII secretion target n=1 Tax=Kitasatospora sp. NPDC002040 TaxID=3154661 RepID=UPI0033226805
MSSQTDFNGYSHADLRRMVGSMDSGGIMSAADPWRRATDTLKQIRTSLTTASSDATTTWEGATSEAFHTKMTTLAAGISNTASYANDAAVALELMSAAIDEAKRTMPEEPSFWSKAADAIGDTAAAATGSEDEDTKTAVTDEKKAQAVAVMNLLASRYRATTDYLKPPPNRITDPSEVVAPDSAGPAVLSALVMGGGVGLVGSTGSGSTSTKSRSTTAPGSGVGAQAPKKVQPSGPTDSGIKGGTANPAPKPASPAPYGPGTGLDGVAVSPKPGTGGSSGPGTHGGPGAGTGTGNGLGGSGLGGGGLAGGGAAGGSPKATVAGGFAGSRDASGFNSRGGGTGSGMGSRAGSAFGASGMPGAGGTGSGAGVAGGGAGGGTGSSAARRAGGTAGAVGSGGAGRGAFTEGGSGLGRGRGQGAPGGAGQGGGMPSAAQAGKKDKKDKRRPDYLVEDEETWATGAPTNPNVVE